MQYEGRNGYTQIRLWCSNFMLHRRGSNSTVEKTEGTGSMLYSVILPVNLIFQPFVYFLVSVAELVRPTVFAIEPEIDVIATNFCVLKIGVTGQPKAKVEWNCDGTELPGDERGFDLLSDGSLRIESAREENAGLYKCTVSNTAGSHQCQIKLRVHPRGQCVNYAIV